jgi:hypothetical protein
MIPLGLLPTRNLIIDQSEAANELITGTTAESKRPATVNKGDGTRQEIGAVAVLPVHGAPGKGNAQLTAALRAALASAGWPVLNGPRDGALTIDGEVSFEARKGDTQKVAIAWTVTSPDGRTLGVVKQANDVPAGSLDSNWGETAGYAAQAAAIGIFDLVERLR